MNFTPMASELGNVYFNVKFPNSALVSTAISQITKALHKCRNWSLESIMATGSVQLTPLVKTSQFANVISFHLLKWSVDLIIYKIFNLKARKDSRNQVKKFWQITVLYSKTERSILKQVNHGINLGLKFTCRKYSKLSKFE